VQSGELDHPGYREALALWEPFARSGHPGASYHVGLLHYFGAGGVSFDQPKGIGLIRSAARQGYPTAQSFLGLLAEQGDGVAVRRSDEEALDWYRKAAAQDQCAAVRRLARAYEQGELGLERAPEQAEQWGRRVAGCRRR